MLLSELNAFQSEKLQARGRVRRTNRSGLSRPPGFCVSRGLFALWVRPPCSARRPGMSWHPFGRSAPFTAENENPVPAAAPGLKPGCLHSRKDVRCSDADNSDSRRRTLPQVRGSVRLPAQALRQSAPCMQRVVVQTGFHGRPHVKIRDATQHAPASGPGRRLCRACGARPSRAHCRAWPTALW